MCQKLRPSNIFESTFRRSMNFLLRYFTRATYFSKSTSASVKVSSRPDLSTNVSIFSFQPAMLEDDARYKVDLNYPIFFVSFLLFVKERKKKIYISVVHLWRENWKARKNWNRSIQLFHAWIIETRSYLWLPLVLLDSVKTSCEPLHVNSKVIVDDECDHTQNVVGTRVPL